MLKARKANRVVKIPDEKKNAYIALGYTITDMDGNLVHEPSSPGRKAEELKLKVAALESKLNEASEYAEKADGKIEELEKENADLKKKVAALESKLKATAAQKKADTAAVKSSDAVKQAVQGAQPTK